MFKAIFFLRGRAFLCVSKNDVHILSRNPQLFNSKFLCMYTALIESFRCLIISGQLSSLISSLESNLSEASWDDNVVVLPLATCSRRVRMRSVVHTTRLKRCDRLFLWTPISRLVTPGGPSFSSFRLPNTTAPSEGGTSDWELSGGVKCRN